MECRSLSRFRFSYKKNCRIVNTSEAGFTLVEVVVTGVIAAIVATTILTVLLMSNSEIQAGLANLRLVQIQAIVSEQIQKSSRIAFCVKMLGDGSSLPNLADINRPGLQEIVLCDSLGDTLSGYQIHASGILNEFKREPGLASGFYPFMVGDSAVRVDVTTSNFSILPRRRGITFTLYYQIQTNTLYTFPGIRETSICRNANR
jgi:type II secretory pathway pseudopilin PulG